MKRAWPYALALAVVVTGCYLALAPLLRSLSPAPTTSSSPLSQNSAVVTVGKARFVYQSPATGSNAFVSNLHTTKKAAKKKVVKKVATSTTTATPAQSPTGNTGFAAAPPSSTPAASSTPATKAPAKTASKKRTASVGGGIDQRQADNGFASPTGSGTVTGGQTLAPGS